MDLAIYAHPWDLRALAAHGGLGRLRDLGFAEVALATSYHAGRWLTPWHPQGMVRFLEDGTVHFRPRGDYGLLQPKVSQEVRDGEPSPLEWLCEHAGEAGLRARAWAVLTHNTRLGELHPECCVENAFGDRYHYALCPHREPVQRYAAAMVRDLVAHPGLHAIELETIGALGHRHNSHHDKSSFATDAIADVLLSTCFCAACRSGLAVLDYEGRPLGQAWVERLRRDFQKALRRHFADADCMESPSPKLDREQRVLQLRREFGAEVMALPAWRALGAMAMLAAIAPVRGPRVRLCAQTNYDALRGGAALPFAMLGAAVDEAAMTVYGEKADDITATLPHLLASRGHAQEVQPDDTAASLRLCLHPRAPQYRSDDDLRKVKDLCEEHGIAAISIYHLGLLPWRTIERTARVLST